MKNAALYELNNINSILLVLSLNIKNRDTISSRLYKN